MFSSTRAKILIGLYVFLILSIPIGAYLASQSQIFKSKASEPKKTNTTAKTSPVATASATQDLLDNSQSNIAKLPSDQSSAPDSSSPEIAISFGPTLSLKAALEGRPAASQATKLFVGILEGVITANPKFLLSFTVDLPASGEFDNLSLAGLNPGARYTALLKGSAQIATASAFIMSPKVTYLNEGKIITMLTGDLNDDNVITEADFAIIQKFYGARANSASWNGNTDFNKDGVINSFDLAILNKNLGKTGASGAWTSPVPNIASPSAGLSLKESKPTFEVDRLTGSPAGSSGGYWIWVPEI
ncbi:hypothetical protein A3C26_03620 [Candidatus Daviesbacteria bacterium RIFCSPHIGHO2_02_FULL_39_12]|uniref:Dockerin domain-containing protein n=2 Tax=Candidatus Daviesiibacteriota TaxID=1752718 RepID=A0A1F5JAE6_9BACT|nr:MAG: hypothetical protein A3C26_03620 [Candidatus Daviesbacteria bacterium RIFCSPHIGHO2_02_FULL_39_12]OGE72829.1 MAG: hypothetical protein A3H40_02070 [Candidatus Daviesbacteria bacterium RIFCSPLOWO2_02_FULL_38_15]